MKEYLIRAISEGNTLVFVFDKFNSFSADKVVDEMSSEANLIFVGKLDFKAKVIINLSQVNYIKVVE